MSPPPRHTSGEKPPGSQPKATAAAFRPLLDSLVQSTTVELFQSRGIAVAPLPQSSNPRHETCFTLAGLVALNAGKAVGSLSLSWDDPIFLLFSPPLVASSLGARDLLRELTNQLAGRLKNRLLNFALVLTIGVPNVLSGQALERQRARRETENVYVFRTLRGKVAVTLDLNIDGDSIRYSGDHRVASEGDFIAF